MLNKKELSEASISSINLAIENPDAIFMSDDDNARLYAINIGLNVIGSTRAIADATVKGIIKSKEEMIDLLYQLKNVSTNPITDEMIADIVAIVENRININEQKNEEEEK